MADLRPESGLETALRAAFVAAGRPAPRILTLEPVPGGSINRSYRVETPEGPCFCKWNPGGPRDLFAAEKAGLEALAAAGSGLIIPEVVAMYPPAGEVSDPSDSSTPASRAAPGEPAGPVLVLEWLDPPAVRSETQWEALGRGLAALHQRTAPAFGFPSDNHCGLTPQENLWLEAWPDFFAKRRLDPMLRRLAAAGRFGPDELAVFRALRERLPGLLPHRPAPALIHGDLWSGNFLATSRGPALIDPAAYFGDREAEWAMMLLFGGFPEAVRSAYEEVLPLPEGWRERLPLHQLWHVLNHHLLFGGGYGAQALRIASGYLRR